MPSVPRKTGKLARQHLPGWASSVSDVIDANGETGAMTALGQDYEIIMLQYQQFGSSTSARSTAVTNIHAGGAAAGHDSIACVYVNGTYASAGSFPTSGAHKADEFLYSGDPAYPYLADSGNTYLMDPRDRGWAYSCRATSTSVPEQFAFRRADASLWGSVHADGGIVDSLGWGVVTGSYNHKVLGNANPPTEPSPRVSVAPVNDQTGNEWQSATEKATWVRYTGRLVGACQEYNPSSWTVGRESGVSLATYCNGVSKGTRWFDINGPTWYLARYAKLVMAENWIRDASEAADFSGRGGTVLNDWLADVNYVVDCQNLGRGAMTWTKVWATHTHTDDVAATVSASTDVFTASGHGLVDGDRVVLDGSTALPGGTSSGSLYWVVSSTSTTFKVSATFGGAAVNITSAGTSVKVRKVISQNSTDDNNDTNITKWHRLVVGSFMLATNGRSFYNFVHDYPSGNQRIPKDRWRDKIDLMGWFTESFTSGLGVWASVDFSTDVFTANAHGFVQGQQVVVDADQQPGGVPGQTTLFVRAVTTNTFKLATTNSDGTIVNVTSNGVNVRVRSSDGASGGLALAKDPTSTNLYVRHFASGIVIVNPTGAGTLNTFTLPAGTWYDVDDTPYTGTVTVDSSNYAMLLRSVFSGSGGGGGGATPDYTAVQAYQVSSSTTSTNASYPTMKSIALFTTWADIERTNNVFTWPSGLDTSLTDAHNNGYKICLRISCGRDSPIADRTNISNTGWMAAFVPYIKTLQNERNPVTEYDRPIVVPVPWDSQHLFYFTRFMQAVATQLAGNCPGGGPAHPRSDHIYYIASGMPTESGTEMSIGYGQTSTTWLKSGTVAPTLHAAWTTSSPANGGTFQLDGDVSAIPQPSAGQYVLLKIGGAIGDKASSAPYPAGTELVLVSAFNRSTGIGTIATNGRGWSGTIPAAHTTSASAFYADDTTTSGALATSVTVDGKTGIFDHQSFNRGQWATLGFTEAQYRIKMGDAWIDGTNAQMDSIPDVPCGLAGSSVFNDGFVQANRVLDTLLSTKNYGKRLVCHTTKLVATAATPTYALTDPTPAAWMLKAKGYGHFIGFQTGGLSELTTPDMVYAAEDAISTYAARFVETNMNSRVNSNSITGATRSGAVATFTTSASHGMLVGDKVKVTGMTPSGYNGYWTITAKTTTTFTATLSADPGGSGGAGTAVQAYTYPATGGWPGGTVTLSEYLLTATSNVQSRLPSS